MSSHSDEVVCRTATTGSADEWEINEGDYRNYIAEAARRGLSLYDCKVALGYADEPSNTVASNYTAPPGYSSIAARKMSSQSDDVICRVATVEGGRTWDVSGNFQKKYLSEARRRGLSLADCRGVLGYADKPPNSQNSGQQIRLYDKYPNYDICIDAVTQSNSTWRWSSNARAAAFAKARGLSPNKCGELLKRTSSVVASASQKQSSQPQPRRLTDTEVCNGATTVDKSGYATWDTKFSDAFSEAESRYLTLKDCAQLTSKRYDNSVELAEQRRLRKQREREAADAARADKVRAAEARRIAAVRAAEDKLRAEEVRKAVAEQARLAEQARRKQRISTARQKRLADARDRLLDPLRNENRNSVAVVIGNRNYSGSTPAVDFAHNDADAITSFLVNKLAYRVGNIIDLRDATRNQIEAVFGNDKTHEGKLFDWTRQGQSNITVYYSGHGVPGLKDKRPYLLPVDGDANRAEITGFPVDVLYENLSKLNAKSVTVYLDACFSGESPKGMLVRSTSGISISPRMPSERGMTVITAAQGDQFASWDETARHGLFTKHLLDALNGKADAGKFGDENGTISLQEVRAYLDDEMTYQARRKWGRRQEATVRGSDNTVLASVVTGKSEDELLSIQAMDATYTVLASANLRVAPSTDAEIVGQLNADTSINITGRVYGENWYRLSDGSYVFGDLIQLAD